MILYFGIEAGSGTILYLHHEQPQIDTNLVGRQPNGLFGSHELQHLLAQPMIAMDVMEICCTTGSIQDLICESHLDIYSPVILRISASNVSGT